jgi:hypothetical protein
LVSRATFRRALALGLSAGFAIAGASVALAAGASAVSASVDAAVGADADPAGSGMLVALAGVGLLVMVLGAVALAWFVFFADRVGSRAEPAPSVPPDVSDEAADAASAAPVLGPRRRRRLLAAP